MLTDIAERWFDVDVRGERGAELDLFEDRLLVWGALNFLFAALTRLSGIVHHDLRPPTLTRLIDEQADPSSLTWLVTAVLATMVFSVASARRRQRTGGRERWRGLLALLDEAVFGLSAFAVTRALTVPIIGTEARGAALAFAAALMFASCWAAVCVGHTLNRGVQRRGRRGGVRRWARRKASGLWRWKTATPWRTSAG